MRAIALAAPALSILYLVASWLVSSFRLIMDMPSANLLVAAPMIAFFGALPIYGILLIIIDKVYQARRYRFDLKVRHARQAYLREQEAERIARAEALAANPDAEDDIVENTFNVKADEDHYPVFKPLFRPLLEQAAAIIVFMMAASYVLSAWNVKIGDKGNPVTAFMDTLSVAFVAWILYRAVVILVDNRLREETGVDPSKAIDVDDEAAGHGSTRLGTLLPLLRNVSITAIAIIAGMIVLSNLGVDIAPLFAGAGVIGLAVGFGAQTLIRDIFSGGFFLFDDAFRKGEYIELGDIRGTVEKISLRSFQLRHHNGPLHTVPFGEIKQLTNYSRDWVIMKLPLRVTYDTDVDKVRKLVKKLGQQLLEHPDVGHNFIQPLKSQGVVQMEDSAMIIRVKFMTKPGDQWVTRKVVYAAIQDLFRREGIHFANREVTVRIAEHENGKLSDKEREVVTGAARSVIDGDVPAAAVDDRG
ncbi:MAG: mechanosensitive ion channel family protein [Nitratireductor sp.]